MSQKSNFITKPSLTAEMILFILLSFCFLIASCGSEKLTREKAAELIKKSEQILKEKDYIKLNREAPKKGIKLEIWKRHVNKFKLTDKGKKYFSTVGDTFVFSGTYRAKLITPTEINVEVTGITDAPTDVKGKLAKFAWNYLNLPSAVKRFAAKGGTGAALFKEYDDGWRIEDIAYEYSREPAELTSKELEEEKKEIAEITEAKKKEADRLKKLVEKSKTRNAILGKFVLNDEHDKNYHQKYEITISDVDVTCVRSTKNLTKYRSKKPVNREWVKSKVQKIWFGPIAKIENITHQGKQRGKSFTQYETRIDMIYKYRAKTKYHKRYNWLSTDKKEIDKCKNVLTSAVNEWKKKYDEIVKRKLF
jgi:hypothetical protein